MTSSLQARQKSTYNRGCYCVKSPVLDWTVTQTCYSLLDFCHFVSDDSMSIISL